MRSIYTLMKGKITFNYSKCIQCPFTPSRHLRQSVRGPIVSLAFLELGETGDQVAEPLGETTIGEGGAEWPVANRVAGVAGRMRISGARH